jgi:hypothetical protein
MAREGVIDNLMAREGVGGREEEGGGGRRREEGDERVRGRGDWVYGEREALL